MYLAELQASSLLFQLALETDKFWQFPLDWWSSHSLILYNFFDRSCPEKALFRVLLPCVINATHGGLLRQENKCECNLSLYNQLFVNLTVADQGASYLGSTCPLVSLISLGDYSIMVLIYIILSMGYSLLSALPPKMKFIVTAACNRLGYSSSTAYKIYDVLQEGHGPYAGIDYTSIVSFSRILTPAGETPILYGCPLISSAFRSSRQKSL